MSMPFMYASEKAMQAIHALALEDTILRGRLFNAFLYLVRLQQDDVPDGALWAGLRELIERASSEEPSGDEGKLKATLGDMSDLDVTKLTEDVVSWAMDTEFHYREASGSLGLRSTS